MAGPAKKMSSRPCHQLGGSPVAGVWTPDIFILVQTFDNITFFSKIKIEKFPYFAVQYFP